MRWHYCEIEYVPSVAVLVRNFTTWRSLLSFSCLHIPFPHTHFDEQYVGFVSVAFSALVCMSNMWIYAIKLCSTDQPSYVAKSLALDIMHKLFNRMLSYLPC